MSSQLLLISNDTCWGEQLTLGCGELLLTVQKLKQGDLKVDGSKGEEWRTSASRNGIGSLHPQSVNGEKTNNSAAHINAQERKWAI